VRPRLARGAPEGDEGAGRVSLPRRGRLFLDLLPQVRQVLGQVLQHVHLDRLQAVLLAAPLAERRAQHPRLGGRVYGSGFRVQSTEVRRSACSVRVMALDPRQGSGPRVGAATSGDSKLSAAQREFKGDGSTTHTCLRLTFFPLRFLLE